MSRRPAFAFVAVLTLGLGACSSPEAPSPDEIERARAAIVNGEPSEADDDSAVFLALFNRGQFVGNCTAAVVAPNLLLTARHCVSQVDALSQCDEEGNAIQGGRILRDHMASNLGVLVGQEFKQDLDANGAEIFTLPETTMCNRDVALVRIDKALNAPVAQLRLKAPVVEGERLRSVGYGVSNNSDGFLERRRRDDVEVQTVGPFTQTLTALGSNEYEVGESVCSGDSGGPAFAQGTHVVIGVASRVGNNKMPSANDPPYAPCVTDGPYVAHGVYMRVDGFPELFQRAFTAAGAEPWEQGEPDPRKAKLAERCELDDDCRSSLCIAQPAGYCTQACDDTPGSCPESLRCESTSAGSKLCVRPAEDGCALAHGRPRVPLGLFSLLALLLILLRRRAA